MSSIPAKRARTDDGSVPVTQTTPAGYWTGPTHTSLQQPHIHQPAQPNQGPMSAPYILHPITALGILDPRASTPVAIYNALVTAALLYPSLAHHLHDLANSSGQGVQPMSYHQPAMAPTVSHQGGAMSDLRAPVQATISRGGQTRQVLQPLAQPSVAPASFAHQTSVIMKKQAVAKKPKLVVPKDKTFITEIRRAEKALDSDRRPFAVQDSLANMTEKIAKEINAGPAVSWQTKKNAVTAIREIVYAIVCTEGPIGRQLKNAGSYDFEVNFKEAVTNLSEEERARLGTEDGGSWLSGLEEVKKVAREYCTMGETLDEITAMLTPESGESIVGQPVAFD